MALSQIQQLAYATQRLVFIYMPSSIFLWEENSQTFQFSDRKKSWGFFFINILLNFLICAAAGYTLFTHFVIHPRDNYNIGYVALHILCVFVTSAPVMFLVMLYTHQDICFRINALLHHVKVLEVQVINRKLQTKFKD